MQTLQFINTMDNSMSLIFSFVLEAFRCMGICVKGKLLPDPEKDALACTCVDDTFTDNRIPVEFYEWFVHNISMALAFLCFLVHI